MRNPLRRLADWVAGPNGWLIADDPNDHALADHRARGDRIRYVAGDIRPPKEETR